MSAPLQAVGPDPMAAATLPQGLTLQVLSAEHAGRLQALRRQIVDSQLPEADCYRVDLESPQFPADHLEPGAADHTGVIGGLFDAEGDLVGYGALTFPKPGEQGRGDILNLPAAERPLMAYLSSAMVRADWRGRGLHGALIDWRLKWAQALGRRHVFSASWPRNSRSWCHLAAHRLQGKALLTVAEGVTRLIFHRDLAVAPPRPDPQTSQLIPVDRLEDQRDLLSRGFWVWQVVHEPGRVLAQVARPLPSTATPATSGTAASPT